jgi:hypothetical protein
MRKRSASYPSKNLKETETFVVSVFENVGDATLKYEELGKHGGVAVREADAFASTANQYGWMTQVRGKGYSPNSTICKALRTPKNDDEKNKLYLAAFLSPHIYKVISNEWNGKKITFEGLKISLIRDHEFSDVGAKLASKIFFDNAKFLGLIDDDSNFSIDAEIKIDTSTIKEKKVKSQSGTTEVNKKGLVKPKTPKEVVTPPHTQHNGSNSMKKISIFVRGQELHWPVPDDMSQSDWDAVTKQIQNIKSFAK